MGFLDWIGVLWNVDGNLAGFGSAGCPALRAARFYVDFRAYISIASLTKKRQLIQIPGYCAIVFFKLSAHERR
ncbi:hypothetical protein OKW34_000651 [Paraburkholderia youngii]|uniref:hypothetical protein n=1 Tax=Paraburkholderia youngii TaxID=2782701 RepID=UPI003D1BCCAB